MLLSAWRILAAAANNAGLFADQPVTINGRLAVFRMSTSNRVCSSTFLDLGLGAFSFNKLANIKPCSAARLSSHSRCIVAC